MVLAFAINIALIFITVLIHYTFLDRVALHWSVTRHHFSTRLFLGSLTAIVAHILEVSVYAIVYYYLHQNYGMGELIGSYDGTFSDALYYSFTCYTSLGIGDIQPEGWLRFTTGVEALVGLIMLAWTASFMFMCMQGQWIFLTKYNMDEE